MSTPAPPAPEEPIVVRVPQSAPVPFEEVRRCLPSRVECVAFRVGPQRYRAICLDFGLVAESTISMLDAQQRLVQQISDYLDDVVAEGCPPHLVNRGLTWWERLQLRLTVALLGLTGLVGSVFPPLRLSGERADWREPIACVA